VDSFARFALEGLGTPAPIAPTQKLVVTGLYRYVRNPIYIGVVAVILVRPFCLVTSVSSGTARHSGFFFMSLW
jgi:protein-S-isoprenylcysteine O-methyltransferase Ste14